MKRMLAAAVAAACISSLGVSSADDSRSVEGNILAPAPQDTTGEVFAPPGIVTRHTRCAYLLAKEAGVENESQGLVGWVDELSEAEGDGETAFTLTSTDGDIAVVFYSDLGTCDNAPLPTTTGEATGEGDEAGVIPFGSTHAIIVVTGAADVGFTFNVG